MYISIQINVYVYICCSVAKLCPTLCDPMGCSTPGFPVLHHLLKFVQIHVQYLYIRAFQVALVVQNLPANAGDIRDGGSTPGLGRLPWRRAWQPTPVFLPGESHGQRSLEGYSQ